MCSLGHFGPFMPGLTLSQIPSAMVVLKKILLPEKLGEVPRWAMSGRPSLAFPGPLLLAHSHDFSLMCVLLQLPSKLFILEAWDRKASLIVLLP